MPDGVLINGKGPYRYNTTLVPDGIDHETINVDPGQALQNLLTKSQLDILDWLSFSRVV